MPQLAPVPIVCQIIDIMLDGSVVVGIAASPSPAVLLALPILVGGFCTY